MSVPNKSVAEAIKPPPSAIAAAVATSTANALSVSTSNATSAALPSPAVAIAVAGSNKVSSSSNEASDGDNKKIIRRIRVIDPRKLQEAGLDRKLAEAISSCRLPTVGTANVKGKPAAAVTTTTTATATTATAIPASMAAGPNATTAATTTTLPSTAKSATMPRLIKHVGVQKLHTVQKPPRFNNVPNITITPAPGSPTPSSPKLIIDSERMTNVKILLQQKILTRMKNSPSTSTSSSLPSASSMSSPSASSTSRVISTPISMSTSSPNITSLPVPSKTSAPKYQNNSLNIASLSKPENRHVANLTSTKLPLDVARIEKLRRNCETFTFDEEIPKASIKTRKSVPVSKKVSEAQRNSLPSTSTAASIAPSSTSTTIKSTVLKFPELSPLKNPYKTVSLSQSAPLPNISTLKKPVNTTPLSAGKMESNENAVKPPVKSLIVLEDKILSQDEKIDLNALCLPNVKTEFTSMNISFGTLPVPSFPAPNEIVIKEEKEEMPMKQGENKAMINPLAAMNSSIEQKTTKKSRKEAVKNLPGKVVKVVGGPQANVFAPVVKIQQKPQKTILRVDKLKLSQQKIAEIAKEIKQKASNSHKQNDDPQPTTIKQTDTSQPIISPLSISETTTTSVIVTTLNSQPIKTPEINISDAHTSTRITPSGPKELLLPKDSTSCPIESKTESRQKPTVEIVEKPSDHDSMSAVDFIASLSSTNPITEETTLELSPEELNLTASFAMNLSPIRIPHTKEPLTDEMTDEEMPSNVFDASTENAIDVEMEIGKIITLSEENVMKTKVVERAEKPGAIITITNEVREIVMINKQTSSMSEQEENMVAREAGAHKDKDNKMDLDPKSSSEEMKTAESRQISPDISKTFDEVEQMELVSADIVGSERQQTDVQDNSKIGETVEHMKEISAGIEESVKTNKPSKVNAVEEKDPSTNELPNLNETEVNINIPLKMNDEDDGGVTKSNSAGDGVVKRISRFRKGKVNLVQRKKSTNLPAINTQSSSEKGGNLQSEPEKKGLAEKLSKSDGSSEEFGEKRSKRTYSSAETSNDLAIETTNKKPKEGKEQCREENVDSAKTDSHLERPMTKDSLNNTTEVTESLSSNSEVSSSGSNVEHEIVENIEDANIQVSLPKHTSTSSKEIFVDSKIEPERIQNVKEFNVQAAGSFHSIEVDSVATSEVIVDPQIGKSSDETNVYVAGSFNLAKAESQLGTKEKDFQVRVAEKLHSTDVDRNANENTATSNKESQVFANEEARDIGGNPNVDRNSNKAADDNITILANVDLGRLDLNEDELSETDHLVESKQSHQSATVETALSDKNQEHLIECADTTVEVEKKQKQISQMLNPPKSLKRKSTETKNLATTQTKTNPSTESPVIGDKNVSLIQPRNEANDLPLTPAKNPFKSKTLEEPPVEPTKGIKPLLNHLETAKLSKDSVKINEKLKDQEEVGSKGTETTEEETASGTTRDTVKDLETSSVLTENEDTQDELRKNKTKQIEETKAAADATDPSIKVPNIVTETAKTKADESVVETMSAKASEQKSEEPTKRLRKRKRKLVEENKKLNPTSDSESDAENNSAFIDNDFDENPSDFHGFDDQSPTSSNLKSKFDLLKTVKSTHEESPNDLNLNSSKQLSEEGDVGVTTIKSWLTTGKAISPTRSRSKEKEKTKERDKSKAGSRVTVSSKRSSVPLKKRWELLQNSNEPEMEVTDDTSPLDDDEEEAHDEQKHAGIRVSMKRRSSDKVIAAKKMKLNDCINNQAGEDKEMASESAKKKRGRKAESKSKKQESTVINEGKKDSSSAGHKGAGAKSLSAVADGKARKTGESKSIIEFFESYDRQVVKTKTEQLTTDQAEEESESKKPTRNKRRRITSEDGDFLASEEPKTTPAVVEHKRGRRSKVVKDEEKLPDSKEIIKTSSSMKGQKSKSDVKSVELNVSKTEAMESDEVLPDKKKKPGRKPKSTAVTSAPTTPTVIPEAQPMIVEKRKPGRKPKNVVNVETPPANAPVSNSQIEERVPEVSETPVVKKKPGRKPKPKPTPTEAAVKESESATPSPAGVWKRGRKPLSANSDSLKAFNSRLLLITKREQLDSDEPLTHVPGKRTAGTVQCGLCLKRSPREKWQQHLSEHYGVGWIVDEMPALDLKSRGSVLTAMIHYFKNTSIGEVNCRLCGRGYRSALGILQHIESCGAPEVRVTCEYCSKEYSPLTVVIHRRTCAARWKIEEKDLQEALSDDEDKTTPEEVYNNVGRLKRASVKKAEKMLKKLSKEHNPNAMMSEADAKNHIKPEKPSVEIIRSNWANCLQQAQSARCPLPKCEFESSQIVDLEQHYENCVHKDQPCYYCTLCTQCVIFASETDAIKHVMKQHKSSGAPKDFEADSSDCGVKTGDEASDEEDDEVSSGVDSNASDVAQSEESITEDVERRTQRKVKKVHIQRPSRGGEVFAPRSSNLSQDVLKHWKSFKSKNHAKEPLFTNAMPNYDKCCPENLDKILPNEKVSMKFAYSETQGIPKSFGAAAQPKWTELNRLRTIQLQQNHLIYLGGPIKKLAWAPLPSSVNEQYLLVSYRPDWKNYTRFQNPKITNTLLLLFKVTPATDGRSPPQSKMHYAINIPEGPVHCFSFMPSGGYDVSMNRLGLLAVGTATNKINIYALPLNINEEKETKDTNDIDNIDEIIKRNVIELKSVIILGLTHMEYETNLKGHTLVDAQCTAICWSEFTGHRHIFAGFSSGCIGIWDINDKVEENLNCFVVEGVHKFVPLNFFYVGKKCIRDLAVHYDTVGPRWLAAASGERRVLIYNMRDMMQPLLIWEEFEKNIVHSFDWSPVWESILISIGDALDAYGRYLQALNIVNISSLRQKLETTMSGVGPVHYNPLLNVIACATDNGDLIYMNPRELHYDDALKWAQNQRVVATIDLKRLDGAVVENFNSKAPPPELYENDYKEKYGLVFGRLLKLETEHKVSYYSAARKPHFCYERYMRSSSLRWNLNSNACQLLAVGYENGFVRLMAFRPQPHFTR